MVREVVFKGAGRRDIGEIVVTDIEGAVRRDVGGAVMKDIGGALRIPGYWRN